MSQICKKCSAEVEDDFVFCPKCGTRMDGKVTCENCGKPVPEDAAVCPYCGVRRDGKKLCPTCGKLLEAGSAFCPYCGTSVSTAASSGYPQSYQPFVPQAQVPVNQPPYSVQFQSEPRFGGEASVRIRQPIDASARKQRQNKLFEILSVSLGMAALLVMFICSMLPLYFEAVTVSISGPGISVGQSQVYDVFYYMSKSFQEINDLKARVGATQSVFFEGMYADAVISLIFALGVFVVSIVFFILGVVNGIRYFVSGRSVNFGRYVAAAFAPYVAFGALVNTHATDIKAMSMTMNGASESMSGALVGGPGGGLLTVLILVPMFLVAMLVFRILMNPAKFVKIRQIMSMSACVAMLVFSTIAVALVTGNALVEKTAVVGRTAMRLTSLGLGTIGLTMPDMSSQHLAASAMMMCAVAAVYLFYGMIYWVAVKKLFCNTKPIFNHMWCAIPMMVFSVLIPIFVSMFINAKFVSSEENMTADSVIAGGLIAGCVIAFLVLAIAVTAFVLDKVFSKKTQAVGNPSFGGGYPAGGPAFGASNWIPAGPVNQFAATPVAPIEPAARQSETKADSFVKSEATPAWSAPETVNPFANPFAVQPNAPVEESVKPAADPAEPTDNDPLER